MRGKKKKKKKKKSKPTPTNQPRLGRDYFFVVNVKRESSVSIEKNKSNENKVVEALVLSSEAWSFNSNSITVPNLRLWYRSIRTATGEPKEKSEKRTVAVWVH
jgi:hypothetical protein